MNPTDTPDDELRLMLPFTLAQADRYACRAATALIRGDLVHSEQSARMSRLSRRIANAIYQVEQAERRRAPSGR